MAEWMSNQQNNTRYRVNQRAVITTNATLGYNSGNGRFARSPTLLKALKRSLQEMLGGVRWYGTMPKECMTAWIMETTDFGEIIATEEMKTKEKKKRKKEEEKKEEENKRKSRKERKGKECGTTPTF
jgi:hypothetical protein